MEDRVLFIINHVLLATWLTLGIGVARLIILERKALKRYFDSKTRDWEILRPVGLRGRYLVYGILVIMFVYVISATIAQVVLPPDYIASNVALGPLSALAFVLSGETLVMSAGTKWLVGLSKVFAIAGVLTVLASAIWF